jgi:hypothetical protein
VTVVDQSVPPQTAIKTITLTIIAPTLAITTTSPLPVGVAGVFYAQTFAAVGPSPQNWSIVSGVAPPGTSLSTSGSLSGTPSVAGAFDFVVRATGGTDPVQTATKSVHMVVNPALAITTISLPEATLATAYSVALMASGGFPNYAWTSPGSGLPAGLTISSSGVISGTPTTPGTFQFYIQVSDSYTPTQQVTRTFTIAVRTTVSITTLSLFDAVQGAPYSQQLQAVGAAPFSWSVTGGTLPVGITLTAAGLLQGTTIAVGSQTFTVTVTDARGATSSQTLTLTVDATIPSLSLSSVPATLHPTDLSVVGMSLSAPYPNPLSGQLVLSFTSTAEVPVDDQATQFSTGSRSVAFTIPANSTDAVFAAPVKLLIGTVSGTVNLAANFDNGPTGVTAGTVQVLPSAPQITGVTATRTIGGVDVQITGYAASRRVTGVEFSFDVKNGSKLQPVVVTKNVDSDFATWYRSPASNSFGSSFSFLQSFTIAGDVSLIQDVTVRLINAQGSTSSSTVRLQ